jgi:5'-AMP-activated protein kinase regulatory gamma subunit
LTVIPDIAYLGLASVALYNQKKWKFAGMFTLLDIIHLIQYYYVKAENFESAAADVETFKIESLRSRPHTLGTPIENTTNPINLIT